MTTWFLGVDPGASGGIAAISADGGRAMTHRLANVTERDVLDLFRAYDHELTKAAIEAVHSSRLMGVKSAFTFGMNYGQLRMAVVAAGIAFVDVTPQRWQRDIGGLASKKAPKRDGDFAGRDKNVSKAKAQQLFPYLTVTHAVADALLIAEWLRRAETSGWAEPSRGRKAAAAAAGGLF